MHGKKLITTIFIFTVIALFSISPVIAQTGKIAGKVVDAASGEPLAGANVVIEGQAMGASTDTDGLYFIINLSPGTYSVTASYVGYQTMTKTEVLVSTNKTTPLEFEINSSTLEAAAIEVIAERPVIKKDLTASERMITSDDIERTWVRTVEEALETQAGVFDGHIRGGTLTETVYMLDNVSLNSGLLSDNYTGINPTTIQEVAVMTGGYNAEYGSANSGIVNVVTKEASSGIHGSVIARMRPAGKYHYGRNMYSRDNYDWTNHDLAFWTEQSQLDGGEYFGQDPQALLNQWQAQITPDPVQSDYADRMQYETEATIYGALTPEFSFLLSGRFKQGVGRFPSVLEYHPEQNFQAKLSYKLSDAMKLSVNSVFGQYETATVAPSNFNSTEIGQEGAWVGNMEILDPYAWNKYALPGSDQWPELRKVNNVSLKWNHALSTKTFYELNVSYLNDDIDKSDRDNVLPPDRFAFDEDEISMLGQYLVQGYWQRHDKIETTALSASGDITSQVTNNHLVKAGFIVKSYDFSYDHYMAGVEGGERWNLMNVFDGTPYEAGAYVQDKIEFSGLIINAGLRLDLFNQNRDAATNMFDPFAYEETTEGNVTPGVPGNPVMENTDMQVVVSPRVGISHPISENTVLHFVYGHFNQRPSWVKMFGFPYITFSNDIGEIYDPFGSGGESYTDQWQGFYGNPKMGYERTIQYEIGVDQNIADLVRLDVTGYYKDASRSTIFREGNVNNPRWGDPNPWAWQFNATNQYNIHIMSYNGAFADVRGLELALDTRFRWPVNFNLNYDLSYASGGVLGFESLYELGSGFDTPHGFGQVKKAWNSNHKFKGSGNVYLGQEYFKGLKPLQDAFLNLYYEYFTGPQYTYHGPGDTSTEPNNKRWEGHHRWNMKVAAGLQTFGVRSELSLEVRNLFDNKTLNLLGGDDLIDYEERGELPKHWWSGEDNEWAWYNIWANPPREIFLQLKVDF